MYAGGRARDRELHERLVAGDGTVLADVYDDTSSLVYGIAAHITGDWAAAQDITQETYLGLWEHPEQFDPDRASLRTWLCSVARHRAIDWLRRTRTRARTAAALAGEQPPAPAAEDAAIRSVVAKTVREAVQALPDTQRVAVSLAYFHGKTYRQVAAELAIPEGTAKSRLRLALHTLANRLAADGITEHL